MARTRWRVSAALFNPRDIQTEHARDAALQYIEENECPRFTVVLVSSVGRKHPERRRWKVLNDAGTQLEELPSFATNKELT